MIYKTKHNVNDKVWIIVCHDTVYKSCPTCGKHEGYIQKHKVYKGVIDEIHITDGYYRKYNEPSKRDKEGRHNHLSYDIWCSGCKFSQESETSNDSRNQTHVEEDMIFKSRGKALKVCKELNKKEKS